MIFDKIRSVFARHTNEQLTELAGATLDPELASMVALITAASDRGIPTLGKMPDDPGTGVSNALAQEYLQRDPMMAARLAEVEIGRLCYD